MFRHFDCNKKIILKIDIFDYVNDEMLFQYDDEKIFHFEIFFDKNIMSIKCNYEIYDKELLIIIRCLKHWCFELKFIDISMKIFNDYKTLKIFITSKNFIRHQTRWIKFFFEYNFKIMYSSNFCNVKTNVFTRFFELISKSENDVRIKQQH